MKKRNRRLNPIQWSAVNDQWSTANGQRLKMRLSECRAELVQTMPSVSILGY